LERLRIGDKIRIIHKGKQEGICTILDILEDYGGESYWLENEIGTLSLEIETPETVFEKIDPNKFPQAIKKLSDQSYLPVVVESTW